MTTQESNREKDDDSVEPLKDALDHVRTEHSELPAVARLRSVGAFTPVILDAPLAGLELHMAFAQQIAPVLSQIRVRDLSSLASFAARNAEMQRSLAAQVNLALPHLEAYRTMTASLTSALASVDLSHFTRLQSIIDVQSAAATAAWSAMLARQVAPLAALNFARLQQTISDVSGALIVQLDSLKSVGSWMSSLTMSTAAFGASAADFRSALLTPMASDLRTFTGASLNRQQLAPISFATVAASGVAGAAAPRQSATPEEAELTILDEEVQAAGIELIHTEHPDLARKLEGARLAIRSRNPDGASQASNSLQELTDRILRQLADEQAALEWCRQNYRRSGIYITPTGAEALTRAGKVRYIAHQGGVDGTTAEAVARIVAGASQILQKGKHDEVPAEVVGNLCLVVEGYVGVILTIARGHDS